MESHQQRVIEEKEQLDGRLASLNTFLSVGDVQGLPHDERVRMTRQAEIMTSYSNVLGERIKAFDLVTE